MGFFDEFLKKVPAEDQSILAKYPELQQSVNQIEDYAGKWAAWQANNWDAEAGMTRSEKVLHEKLAAAQSRVDAGFGTSADVKSLEAKLEARLADVAKQSEAQVNGLNFFYRSAYTKLLPHQQEFKENLDPQKLVDFMQVNHINDPDLAYDKMVAGRRAELAVEHQKEVDAKHAADLEAARNEGYAKRAQEVAMGPNGMLPTDHTGGIIGVTASIGRQPAAQTDAEKSAYAKAALGDGSLAAMGYQKFLRGDYDQVQ